MPARSTQVGIRTFHDTTEGLEVLTAPWLHRNGIDGGARGDRARGPATRRSTSASTSTGSTRPSRRGPARRCRAGSRAGRRWSWCAGSAPLDLVGMDMVEVSPPFDHAEITALAAAHLAHDWLCLLAAKAGARAACRSAGSRRPSRWPPDLARRVHRPPARGLPRPGSAGRRIEEVECVIADIAGISRGKAMPFAKFMREDRMFLPTSIFHQTIAGDYVDMDDRQPVDRVRHGAEARLRDRHRRAPGPTT